jgi:hypothetical protein
MKRKLLSFLFLGAGLIANVGVAQTLHRMKIVLDTRKFNNINCSLNAPCDGVTPTPLTKVYMHAGVCWNNAGNTSDINSPGAEIFCIQQISPLNSLVWQSVVGNWGNNPQDDNVGVMVDEGNGIFTKEFDLELYFSSPDVSTETNTLSNPPITSMPMNPNATPYTMGLVFRDATGTISGRDSTCNDIFIWKLATTPEVIQSDFSNWTTGPVSFEYGVASVTERDLAYNRQISPNPMNESVQIKFYLAAAQQDFEMNVFDATGRKVKTIYRGQLPIGSQTATWDATDDAGNRVEPGMYFFTMRSGTSVVTDRLVLTN